MSFLEITDVESVKPGLSFSRSPEGRLINRRSAGQVSWQRMATGGGPLSQI